ncbi:unnamed protein product [Adineta steineri]|uniref:Uncharacterized protein n=1 Tax=Adineta steineri TaxID=433720 RepID=A0A814GGC7_9BILA|nr:unnamed protein product [Adineta steineri]CAF3917142.1 unnamed protein product [Adineta steineri]
MEEKYILARSPYIDQAKWIEKLKYDVLRFRLDSIDLNLIEVENVVNVQVRNILFTSSSFIILLFWICMCIMHTSLCNESLTLKVEAGSISIPELRINAKFECHSPTPATINE